MMQVKKSIIPIELIRQAILILRGQKVILDRDLASLYGVPTKALKQAVKRNRRRFPPDFMFVLDPQEFSEWRSQFVTSNADRMGLRHVPMAFTEQGIAMLLSVLNSERAIQVNIAIMRAFVKLREMITTHKKLADKLDTTQLLLLLLQLQLTYQLMTHRLRRSHRLPARLACLAESRRALRSKRAGRMGALAKENRRSSACQAEHMEARMSEGGS